MSACVCDRTIALGFQLGYLAHKVFRREASCVAVAAVVTALAARIAPVRPLAARDAEPSSMAAPSYCSATSDVTVQAEV